MIKLRNIPVLIYTILVLCTFSCVSVYFDQPQPVDAKNMKKFPKKLRGTWVQDDDTTLVGKTIFRKVEWNSKLLSRTEIDTNDALVIRGDKIYNLDEDSTKGFNFVIQNDSILINVSQVIEYKLGNAALLRSVSKDYYILNVRKDSIWWNVFLIEKKSDGTILAMYPKKGELSILKTIFENDDLEIKIPYVEDKLTTSEFQKFWKVELTSKQIIEFRNKGGFTDTSLVLEPKYKIE